MKNISISYFDGDNATKFGARIVLPEQPESKLRHIHGGNTYFCKASSTDFRQEIEAEMKRGRTKWAQLAIEIDDISLAFWLPAELDAYCKVFATTPFPTARTLLKQSPDSTELNSHWLSRLPKKAKSEKFRARFLRYVETRPTALVKFQDFYREST